MFHPDRILAAAEQQINSVEYQTAKLEPPPSGYVGLAPLNSDWSDEPATASYAPSYTASEAASSQRAPSEPASRASGAVSTVGGSSMSQQQSRGARECERKGAGLTAGANTAKLGP
mmetsp:Transcript_9536/g.28682  ORF Transcript_9536/g.28682 Transcript_9536/m.28682 type:complete len:116 (-) Transcript_9536:940-1287(-)